LFALTPVLKKWMHTEVPMTGEQAPNAANT
jgi:hypothetical protein